MVSYKDRIAAAMARAQVTDSQLAKRLGISIQAVRKVAAGTTTAFTAENNAKAAAYLGVRSDWLATGEGSEVPDPVLTDWPLKTLSYADFIALPEEFHDGIEKLAQPYVKSSQTLMQESQRPPTVVTNREQKGFVFVNHKLRVENDGTGHSDQDERTKPAPRKSAGNR